MLLKPAEKISPDELDVTVDSLRKIERIWIMILLCAVLRFGEIILSDRNRRVTEDEIQELLSSKEN